MNIYKTKLRETLVSQLTFFDEELTMFLDRYLPASDDVRIVRERKNMKAFIERYMFKLEQHLKHHTLDEDIPCPDFVFLGSTVTVQYEDTNHLESYTLCLPEESDPDTSCISMISPLGSQLLMAVKDSQITIVTPGQITKVTIVDIKYS
ncbi:GreA/GreB family elongation factor [Paenibacillus faecalis]|uniref:GreA/GreB family elongation factor n=1 Tax=Paenibacillus faecalis TaxID=2079532 RepID=UPI00131A5270|nr:GreA/GreB family elongation factor [Paenibacillus faecalis]